MTQTDPWRIEDFRYTWLPCDGGDSLKINDHTIKLPELPIPENAQYLGPLLQGLYGRQRPCTISRRLQLLLLDTLQRDPNYFSNITKRRWYYIPRTDKQSLKEPKKRGRPFGSKNKKKRGRPKVIQLNVCELD